MNSQPVIITRILSSSLILVSYLFIMAAAAAAAAAAALALQELDDYLNQTVGILAAKFCAHVNAQGLLSLGDFALLEENDIEQLCSNVCKPGGMATIRVPQNLMVAHPGYPIGHIQVHWLKLLRYYVVHLKPTQQSFVSADAADLARLAGVYCSKDLEDDAPDVPYPDKLTSIDKVFRTIDNIDAWLLKVLGYCLLVGGSIAQKCGSTIWTTNIL
jgi:hypothetical protein